MPDSIYLDNQATTPTDPRVRDAMLPLLETTFVGNPHSEHFFGRRAAMAVEDARAKVAALIGAQPHEIVFTSGATEANNLSPQGVARSSRRSGNHIITCATEHKCVLEIAEYLARNGFRVDILPVGPNGLLDIVTLQAAITGETCLVSIMTANNEVGVLQPIEDIASLCRSRAIVKGAPLLDHSCATPASRSVPRGRPGRPALGEPAAAPCATATSSKEYLAREDRSIQRRERAMDLSSEFYASTSIVFDAPGA
jgi:selenocysteine lyase/cysteine desulfurase